MKKIRLGMQWACGASILEVTKMFKNGKCQITEKWIAEDTGKNCEQTRNWEIGTDENGNEYAYRKSEIYYDDYKLHSGAAINMQEDETDTNNNEEENTMKENTTTTSKFALDGAIYESTPNGRFFCTPLNGKKTRVGKAAFDAAFTLYVKKGAEIQAQIEDENPELGYDEPVQPEPKKVDKKWKKLNAMMEKLGYYPCESAFDDIRYHTLDGQSKVMAWNTVEEGLEWAKANTPKPEKKPRTKKVEEGGAKFEIDGQTITLTAKQVDFIHHLPDTCFWENGLDSLVWVDVLCDEIGGQFAGKPMTVGAMVSTLCEKGLGNRAKDKINGRKATYFGFTEVGKKVAAELGL